MKMSAGQHTHEAQWNAKYAALIAQLEDIEDQIADLENERCCECHELRTQHDADCEFAATFDEPTVAIAEVA